MCITSYATWPCCSFKLLFLNKGALLTIFRFRNPYQGLDSSYAKVTKSMSRCMIDLHRMWLEPLPLSVSPCHLPDKWELYEDRRHGKTVVASPWNIVTCSPSSPMTAMCRCFLSHQCSSSLPASSSSIGMRTGDPSSASATAMQLTCAMDFKKWTGWSKKKSNTQLSK